MKLLSFSRMAWGHAIFLVWGVDYTVFIFLTIHKGIIYLWQMTSVFRMMQASRPGPNLGWIRKNAIEDSIELFYMILLWACSLEKFTTWLTATRSSEAYFYKKSRIIHRTIWRVECWSEWMPNDDLNKNYDIIALMVKCVKVLA